VRVVNALHSITNFIVLCSFFHGCKVREKKRREREENGVRRR